MFFASDSNKNNPKGMNRRSTRPGGENPMQILSSEFENNQMIPPKFTCDGDDINPPLSFSGVPLEARSLVLIVHDPDAPAQGGWTHWLVFNIKPATTFLSQDSVPTDAVEGLTSFGNTGYGGPCPPSGTHRYHFKLYALDSMLMLDENAQREDVEKAMQGHIVDQAVLTGLYKRENQV